MTQIKQQGFTLLELLIVISIIGILAGITIISYPGISQKAKLANAIKFSDNVRGSLQPDMVAWWKFDETLGTIAKDSWWNEFHGTVVGATWVEGIKGNALSFDGVNDYVKVDSVVVQNPLALTIAAWFQKNGNGSNYECVLHQSSDASIGSSSYWMGATSDDYLAATIGANTGVGWAAGQTNIKVILEEWNYLVASWNGSVVKVYVNGKYIKSYPLTTYVSLTTPTRMGASSDGSNYQFNGLVDDVQIYSAALPLSMIQQLYAEGLATHQNLAIK